MLSFGIVTPAILGDTNGQAVTCWEFREPKKCMQGINPQPNGFHFGVQPLIGMWDNQEPSTGTQTLIFEYTEDMIEDMVDFSGDTDIYMTFLG